MPPEYVAAGLRAASTRSNRSSSSVTRPRPSATEMVQIGHQPEVLLARQQVVQRGELTGDADALAHPVGVVDDVVTSHADLPGVSGHQGGQDPHERGLAGAVGAEEGEHRALGHRRGRRRRARPFRRTTSARRSPRSSAHARRSHRPPGGSGSVPHATSPSSFRPLGCIRSDVLGEEFRELRPPRAASPAARRERRRRISRPSCTSSLISSYSAVSSTLRLRRGQVEAHPVHPLAGRLASAGSGAWSRDRDGVGDRATTGQQRLGQFADALRRRIADGQVAETATHHRRGGTGARGSAHVVGDMISASVGTRHNIAS